MQDVGFNIILKNTHLISLNVNQERDDKNKITKRTFSFTMEHIAADRSLTEVYINLQCSPEARALFDCEFAFPPPRD